jgi:hypothetical protein
VKRSIGMRWHGLRQQGSSSSTFGSTSSRVISGSTSSSMHGRLTGGPLYYHRGKLCAASVGGCWGTDRAAEASGG